jgi:hypothetical protein
MNEKFKIVEVSKKHKSHPKVKVWMNIPFCKMILMPKVHLTLKINVLKMEHVFHMGYCEGDKVFYVFLTN